MMRLCRFVPAAFYARGDGGLTSWRSSCWASSYIANRDHCIELVKDNDHDEYLVSQNLPSKHRIGYLVLQAFNVETASIKDRYPVAIMARSRLKWWWDTIDQIFQKKKLDHPVANLLFIISQRHNLSKSWFKRIIAAREEALDNNYIMSGMEQLEDYGESTRSALLYLTLQLAGISDVNVTKAARHIGKAHAIVLCLKDIPNLVKKGKVEIPSQLVAKHNVNIIKVINEVGGRPLRDAVFEMASCAKEHLMKAREERLSILRRFYPYLHSSVPLDLYLSDLKNVDYNVMDESLKRIAPNYALQCDLSHKYFLRQY